MIELIIPIVLILIIFYIIHYLVYQKRLQLNVNFVERFYQQEQKFCPDPNYIEFNPVACADPKFLNTGLATKDECIQTPVNGYIPDETKCITKRTFLGELQHENSEFRRLLMRTLNRKDQGISRKVVIDNLAYSSLDLSSQPFYLGNDYILDITCDIPTLASNKVSEQAPMDIDNCPESNPSKSNKPIRNIFPKNATFLFSIRNNENVDRSIYVFGTKAPNPISEEGELISMIGIFQTSKNSFFIANSQLRPPTHFDNKRINIKLECINRKITLNIDGEFQYTTTLGGSDVNGNDGLYTFSQKWNAPRKFGIEIPSYPATKNGKIVQAIVETNEQDSVRLGSRLDPQAMQQYSAQMEKVRGLGDEILRMFSKQPQITDQTIEGHLKVIERVDKLFNEQDNVQMQRFKQLWRDETGDLHDILIGLQRQTQYVTQNSDGTYL